MTTQSHQPETDSALSSMIPCHSSLQDEPAQQEETEKDEKVLRNTLRSVLSMYGSALGERYQIESNNPLSPLLRCHQYLWHPCRFLEEHADDLRDVLGPLPPHQLLLSVIPNLLNFWYPPHLRRVYSNPKWVSQKSGGMDLMYKLDRLSPWDLMPLWEANEICTRLPHSMQRIEEAMQKNTPIDISNAAKIWNDEWPFPTVKPKPYFYGINNIPWPSHRKHMFYSELRDLRTWFELLLATTTLGKDFGKQKTLHFSVPDGTNIHKATAKMPGDCAVQIAPVGNKGVWCVTVKPASNTGPMMLAMANLLCAQDLVLNEI